MRFVVDKEILLAIGFAAVAVGFFSLVIFSPSDEMERNRARPTYAQDDIRFSHQQAEAKKPKKKPKAETPDAFVTDGSTSAGGEDEGEPANEEPSIDDGSQEEPEIE
jgi:hypothetical protein